VQEKKETNVTFALELKKLLDERNMTAASLAKALEISHVAIGNYLKGRLPHGDILVEIARYFGKSADDLLFGPEAQRAEALKNLHIRDQEIEVDSERLSDIRRADPEAYKTLRKVIATYHGTAIKGVSSKVADVAIASQASASELARRELQEQQRKQRAAGPSEHKDEQGRGDQARPKRRPGFRGKAPK